MSALHEKDSENILSRRGFVAGAAGVGAACAVGAAAVALKGTSGAGDEVLTLRVPVGAMTPLTDFEALDSHEDKLRLTGSFDLPFGTLVWADSPNLCACLLRTETGSPLTKIALLHLSSGYLQTVRETPVGKADGFEIYDVRACDDGIIWTEANILANQWRIYGSTLNGKEVGAANLLDQCAETYIMPTLCVAGGRALWQKIPRNVADFESPSKVMSANFDGSDCRCIHSAKRRNATPINHNGDTVVIAPRLDNSTVYHQLTSLNAKDGTILETLTLPAAMRPQEAGFGPTGFNFSFPDIYNYGGGISNLGTYAPMALPENGNYNGASWFGFNRTPSAPLAWAGPFMVVKSTYSVCCVDLAARNYFAIDVENGAERYGECLASVGSAEHFVTFTNIDHTPVGADRIHTCRVKVWEPA